MRLSYFWSLTKVAEKSVFLKLREREKQSGELDPSITELKSSTELHQFYTEAIHFLTILWD